MKRVREIDIELTFPLAEVAQLVDASVSKTDGGNSMPVRSRPSAPKFVARRSLLVQKNEIRATSNEIMIITKPRDFEKIKENLKSHHNIIIIGCGRCATSCETGGEKEVLQMKLELEKLGKKIIHYVVIEAPCDERLVKRELKNINLNKADCILCMSCGSGTSAINDLTDTPVYPALDSVFLGVAKNLRTYDERCSMCGECVLDKTLGICPVTRCSKGLLNGPCGGSHNGKCEVDPERDCAWSMIYEKLKKYNKLDNFKEYWEPKSYRFTTKPQVINK